MSTHIKKSLIVTGILIAASATTLPTALAQNSGFYGGGSVGQSKAENACDDLGGIGFSGSCDDTDTGWKLFAGYQFNPNFAVEAGYVDLGKFTAAGTISGVPVSTSDEANLWQLVAVGTLPMGNNFSVFGKAGVHRWDLDAKASVPGVSVSISENGTDFTFGLGARYDFTKSLGVRAEWERFQSVGDENTTGESDVDLLSVGLQFRF